MVKVNGRVARCVVATRCGWILLPIDPWCSHNWNSDNHAARDVQLLWWWLLLFLANDWRCRWWRLCFNIGRHDHRDAWWLLLALTFYHQLLFVHYFSRPHPHDDDDDQDKVNTKFSSDKWLTRDFRKEGNERAGRFNCFLLLCVYCTVEEGERERMRHTCVYYRRPGRDCQRRPNSPASPPSSSLALLSSLFSLLYSRPHTAAGRPPPLLPNLSLSSTPDTPERTNACKKIKVEEEEEEAFSLSHEDFRLLLLLLLRKTKQEPSRDIQS